MICENEIQIPRRIYRITFVKMNFYILSPQILCEYYKEEQILFNNSRLKDKQILKI